MTEVEVSSVSLSHRARKILLTVVGDFIATGEPVASKNLALHHGLELSPASIRAVLAELEAAGYLVKPHTSAGRVPTDAGIRFFAEAMVNLAEPRADDRLARRLAEVAPGIDALLRHANKVLAELSGGAALLRPPRTEAWVLKDLRFLVLRPYELLAVIVATNGAVEHRVLRVDDTPTPAELDRVNNLLAARIEGRTLGEIRAILASELSAERARSPAPPRPQSLAVRALEMGDRAIAAVTEAEGSVLVEGAAQLIERPEFSRVDAARALLRTLDDEALLLTLLDEALRAPGLRVVIGSEHAGHGIGPELSLVMASFDEGAGVVGVIGSQRMDYSQVVPLVRQTAERLSQAMRTG